MHAMECGKESVYPGRVAGQFGKVFDTVHDASSGVGQRKHQPLVGYEIFHTRPLATVGFDSAAELESAAQAAPSGKKDRKSRKEVAKCGPGVLQNKVFQHIITNLQAVDTFHPGSKFLEAAIEKDLLDVRATIESYLLSIDNQAGV